MEDVPAIAMTVVSDPISQTATESEGQSSEYAADDFRRNSGSYRKRKAKKQVDAETTVEDLRGQSNEESHH
jgi:hypothetical protein